MLENRENSPPLLPKPCLDGATIQNIQICSVYSPRGPRKSANIHNWEAGTSEFGDFLLKN